MFADILLSVKIFYKKENILNRCYNISKDNHPHKPKTITINNCYSDIFHHLLTSKIFY